MQSLKAAAAARLAWALAGWREAPMALALPLTVLLGNYARFGTQGLYAPTAAVSPQRRSRHSSVR
ncbi:hypothetical protein [Streptomyces sp. NPDC057199]|uniref:hypothetical protein n=1 Tax=Streptomyces sp. NPDC057199 TaxID=3346047 RepID=UPI003643E341